MTSHNPAISQELQIEDDSSVIIDGKEYGALLILRAVTQNYVNMLKGFIKKFGPIETWENDTRFVFAVEQDRLIECVGNIDKLEQGWSRPVEIAPHDET